MASEIQSICVLRLSAIGDVCHAVAMVQALQRQYPNAHITWIVGKIEAVLLAGLPGVELVVFDKKQGLAAFGALRRALAGRRFDVLLHMQVAFRANVASLFIKAKRKIGYDWHRAKELHALFMRERVAAASKPHVLDGFMDFATHLGVTDISPRWQMPLSSEDEDWAFAHMQSDNARHFVICPAASKAERNWLPERYAQVAIHAANQGFKVYLCGGPSNMERQLASDIITQVDLMAEKPVKVSNLVGKTSLKQLLALLKHASLVMAPDTGPAHMAVTVNTPVIGLYGHSNPARTGPYLYQSYVVEVYHQHCQQQHQQAAEQLPWGTRVKGDHIMADIQTDTVLAMFDRVVAEQRL